MPNTTHKVHLFCCMLTVVVDMKKSSSKRWEQSVLHSVTQQSGKRNERSRTATSRSQQQIRTES
jgi:hypothetical protein